MFHSTPTPPLCFCPESDQKTTINQTHFAKHPPLECPHTWLNCAVYAWVVMRQAQHSCPPIAGWTTLPSVIHGSVPCWVTNVHTGIPAACEPVHCLIESFVVMATAMPSRVRTETREAEIETIMMPAPSTPNPSNPRSQESCCPALMTQHYMYLMP